MNITPVEGLIARGLAASAFKDLAPYALKAAADLAELEDLRPGTYMPRRPVPNPLLEIAA